MTWRGKTVPIRNEKARVFILRYEDRDSELERQATFEERMGVFDNLMMECKDALQEIKDEIATEMVSLKITSFKMLASKFIQFKHACVFLQ